MDRLLTRDQVQAQLQAKTDEIAGRLDAIQREIGGAPRSVKDAMDNKPLLAVAGAVAAGLLVGLVIGGSKKKFGRKAYAGTASHQALIENYVASIAADARAAVQAGADAGEAVQKALRDRVPLIVLGAEASRKEAGFLRDAIDLALKTAMGFAVKIGIDQLTSRLHLEELLQPIQTHGGTDAAAPVAAFTSED